MCSYTVTVLSIHFRAEDLISSVLASSSKRTIEKVELESEAEADAKKIKASIQEELT